MKRVTRRRRGARARRVIPSRKLASFVSTFALLLAALHFIFPGAGVDAIALALLFIAFLPWLPPVRKVEVNGVATITFQEFRKAFDQAVTSGLIPSGVPPPASSSKAYFSIADANPRLGLIGLRVEFEDRVRRLDSSTDVKSDDRDLQAVLGRLEQKGILTSPETTALRHISSLMKTASRAETLQENAGAWAKQVGPPLLAALETRLLERTNTPGRGEAMAAGPAVGEVAGAMR